MRRRGAFTLVEVALVIAILVSVAAFVVPSFMRQIEGEYLLVSANNFRTLLNMTQANAAFDGKRYRIRFPREDEYEEIGDPRQPLIEREDDPFDAPEEYFPVAAPWAHGETLVGKVRCAEVRLGKPSIFELQEMRLLRDELEDFVDDAFEGEDFDIERPPIFFEPDGSSEWATFVLTEAPAEVGLDELEDYPTIEVIFEGETGFAWLQRPLMQEELDLFEEKGWPAVLRQDFTDPRMLTEDDVLELRDMPRDAADASAGAFDEGATFEP